MRAVKHEAVYFRGLQAKPMGTRAHSLLARNDNQTPRSSAILQTTTKELPASGTL